MGVSIVAPVAAMASNFTSASSERKDAAPPRPGHGTGSQKSKKSKAGKGKGKQKAAS